jgi:hypothetical protein
MTESQRDSGFAPRFFVAGLLIERWLIGGGNEDEEGLEMKRPVLKSPTLSTK